MTDQHNKFEEMWMEAIRYTSQLIGENLKLKAENEKLRILYEAISDAYSELSIRQAMKHKEDLKDDEQTN